MTTKNLSRELCEICGIEPINKTIISCGCEDRTRYFRTYDPKRCQGCNKSIKASVYKEIHKVVYPDFTQPENFVKLFELEISDSTVTLGAAVCFCNRRNLNNRNDFLEAAIQQAKYNKDIRQAIKSEVWKYD